MNFWMNMELNKNYKNTVILAGSGRSGTSWLADLINYDNEFRYLFEPFHSKKISLLKHFNFRQYLPIDNMDSRFFVPIKKILSGKIYCPWIDQYNRKAFSQKRLIKDIRINLMLGWIKNNFPEIPIILLLRNPGAVAVSRKRLGWGSFLDKLLYQQDLISDFLSPRMNEIKEIRDKGSTLQKSILDWCIENYVPLRQLENKNIFIIYYEDLVNDTAREIKKLFEFLNKETGPRLSAMYSRLSKTLYEKEQRPTKDYFLNYWKNFINPGELDEIDRILKIFSLDKLYNVKNI